MEEKAYWEEEHKKCVSSFYYFYYHYVLVNGKKPIPRLSEEEFNKVFEGIKKENLILRKGRR